MRTRLYVGNISFSAVDADLREFFHDFKLADVKIITDRETGRQRGFAFVAMESPADAKRAIDTLNETEMGGRRIMVSEAKEREARPAPQRGRDDHRGRDRD